MAALISLRATLLLLGALSLAALAMVVADAVVILPRDWRVAAPWLLAVLGVVVAVLAMGSLWRLSEVKVARAFEQRYPELGTSLTNAVQLSREPGEEPIGKWLRSQAVTQGAARAKQQATWPVAKRSITAAAIIFSGVAACWVVGLLLFGDVFDAVLPRFTDPDGDHPPYSRLRIEVTPSEQQVLFGGQVDIAAVTSGAPAEKLFLVATNDTGESETVMFRRPDQSYFQALTNLREPTEFWVTDGRARSKRQRVEIRYTPQITLVEVRSRFPAYTGLRARERRFEGEDLAVPQGTELTFRVTSNRPLESGAIELTPLLGDDVITVELSPASDTGLIVEGKIKAEQAAAFAITVKDVDGLTSNTSPKGRVTIIPDRRPVIAVMEPGRHAVATPDVKVPVRVRAEDDYGIAQVYWFRGLNGSIERPMSMNHVDSGRAGVVEAEAVLDLADLGVRPGDRVSYFFEAVDNYPAGPNVTTSRIYTLEIISNEQYQAILRSAAARRALFDHFIALDHQLRRVAERARTLEQAARQAKAKPGDADAQASADEAGKAMDAALGDYLKALAQAMARPPMFDIEQAFREHLRQHADAGAEATDKLNQMRREAAARGGAIDPESAKELADRLAALSGQMNENVGKPAKMVASVARLLAAADAFTQLTLRQGELVRLARRFEDQQGELSRIQQMELQEIASAQRRIQDDLTQLLDRIDRRIDDLPDDPTFDELRNQVRQFLDAVEDAQIKPDLSTATSRFAGLDGPRGVPAARSAHEKMNALVAKCEGMDMPGTAMQCLKFQPSLSKALGDSLSQIMAAMQAGSGQSGGSGYGLFGEDVGIYGPDVQMSGAPGGRHDIDRPQAGGASRTARASGDADDPALRATPDEPGRVRLQHQQRFPLRYRGLVGDYFRAVAESEE